MPARGALRPSARTVPVSPPGSTLISRFVICSSMPCAGIVYVIVPDRNSV